MAGNFTAFPVPYNNVSDKGEVSSLDTTAHIVVSIPGTGVRRIKKSDIGFARITTSSTQPSGTKLVGDVWIDTSVTPNRLKVWNGTNWFYRGYIHPDHTGDVTSASDGATTISPNVVTNDKLAQMPSLTIKGNDTGGAADPKDLTASEVRTLLGLGSAAVLNTGVLNGTIPLVGVDNKLAVSVIPVLQNLQGTLPVTSGGTGATTADAARTNLQVLRSLNQTVVVRSKSDLPAPVAGAIQLADNTEYIISGGIDLVTDYLVQGANTVIRGFDPFQDKLVYTGTGALWRSTDKQAYMACVGFSSTAEVFEWTSTDGTHSWTTDLINAGGGTKVGTFSGGTISHFRAVFEDNDDGITFTGACNAILLSQCVFTDGMNAGGSFVEFDSGFSASSVHLFNNLFFSDNGTHITVDPTAASSITTEAFLTNNIFTGAATKLSGVTGETVGWTLRANTAVLDSLINGEMYFVGNSTATSLSVQNTWYKISIATTAGELSKFTHTSPNRLTYVGRRPIKARLIAALNAYSAQNTLQEHEVCVYKNGVQVASTVTPLATRATDTPVQSVINSFIYMEENDYVEIYIRNTTSANDITIQNMSVTISD